jgi:hypothetical protein
MEQCEDRDPVGIDTEACAAFAGAIVKHTLSLRSYPVILRELAVVAQCGRVGVDRVDAR